jgi:Protein of unknown function (DUF2971)
MNIDARDGETFRELCEKAPVKPEIFDFEGTNPDVARVDQWYASAKGGLEQALLTAKYNNPGFAANHNTALIMGEFPIQYVKLLEKPVLGDWYTACFSKNFVNSSMWGHYANKHKGVCLKFNSGRHRTRIGNHTFRATGITAYLKNSGKLEVAQQIANHESPRTTKLYDRRQDEISLDEIERITI